MRNIQLWEMFIALPYFLALLHPFIIGWSFVISMILNIVLIKQSCRQK